MHVHVHAREPHVVDALGLGEFGKGALGEGVCVLSSYRSGLWYDAVSYIHC